MAVRITQLPVEVLRTRNPSATVRVTQVAVEVLVPFVPVEWKFGNASASFTLSATAGDPEVIPDGVDYAKASSASFTLTAAAAVASVAYGADGAAAIVFTPAAAVAGVARSVSAVPVTIVFAPAAAVASVDHVSAAEVTIVFTPAAAVASVVRSVAVGAGVAIVFRARARAAAPEAVVGDGYIGRYQEGQEVPLWVVVVDARGRPLDPTTATPTATIYNLDTATRVGSVDLHRLRGSRVSAAYARALRLGHDYPPGRYGVLIRASTGAFTGQTLATFEVQSGGDALGPLGAAHAHDHPAGWRFLAQAASGALVAGRRPRIPT